VAGIDIPEFLGEVIAVTQDIEDAAGSKNPVGQDICINKPDLGGYGLTS